jgi:hypothetical protein
VPETEPPANGDRPTSDQLLVEAINAVTRVRGSVDRVTIFCELKKMLVNDCCKLDQRIESEQLELAAIVQQAQARIGELQERRQTVVRALQVPALRTASLNPRPVERVEAAPPMQGSTVRIASPSRPKSSPPPLARKGGSAS